MANWGTGLPAHSTPPNYEKPLSVPCHEGVQKAVFDHMLDYRQTWSMRKQWRQELRRASIIKQNGYKAPEKVEKFLFKSFDTGSKKMIDLHEFCSNHSAQDFFHK